MKKRKKKDNWIRVFQLQFPCFRIVTIPRLITDERIKSLSKRGGGQTRALDFRVTQRGVSRRTTSAAPRLKLAMKQARDIRSDSMVENRVWKRYPGLAGRRINLSPAFPSVRWTKQRAGGARSGFRWVTRSRYVELLSGGYRSIA